MAKRTIAAPSSVELPIKHEVFEQVYRAAKDHVAGNDEDTLFAEVLDLADHVLRRDQPGSALHRFFEPLHRKCEERTLTLSDVHRAKAVFYSLPESEQRRYLSGWRPSMERMARHMVNECNGANCGRSCVKRYLKLRTAGGNSISAAQQSCMDDGESQSVMVQIPEGADRQEVFQALLAMAGMVASQWPELINLEPDSFDCLDQDLGEIGEGDNVQKLQELMAIVKRADKQRQGSPAPVIHGPALPQMNPTKAKARPGKR